MKEIQLTQGKVALVDDEHFEELNKFKWFAHHRSRGWYASRNATKAEQKNGAARMVHMHREILQAPQGKEVDHIDHNGLNNTLQNLRLASPAQNQRNQRLSVNNKSGYKGVCWNKATKKWRADIKHDYKSRYLGSYNTAEEAAQAYNEAAVQINKEFANLNILEETDGA